MTMSNSIIEAHEEYQEQCALNNADCAGIAFAPNYHNSLKHIKEHDNCGLYLDKKLLLDLQIAGIYSPYKSILLLYK